ncbi:hypothetical protein K470DRAFT_292191 [Piedraia hortae CBS 480.64]|uniref:CID domain-containing protein n=1 Tax=Piedraia hortae CBS 480.64 TaxID=1314780 RepID=A0A6A7CAU2_9PEZI|nr:hypothetical protein K470DRAFT_292191 [Piedraia hortae CBS 480.64]
MGVEEVCEAFATNDGAAAAVAYSIMTVANICTHQTMKACTEKVLNYTTTFERSLTLGLFLVKLATELLVTEPPTSPNHYTHAGLITEQDKLPCPEYRRLHLVYIVNDTFCAVETHLRAAPDAQKTVQYDTTRTLLKQIAPLLINVAALQTTDDVDTTDSLRAMLPIWQSLDLLTAEQTATQTTTLQTTNTNHQTPQTLTKATLQNLTILESTLKVIHSKASLTLPLRHSNPHDPSAPWHALPAANGLYMLRTRGYPLRTYAFPAGGYQLRNGGQPPPPPLQNETKALHTEMLQCFSNPTSVDDISDIDELGNVHWKDPNRKTRNYWGFAVDEIERVESILEGFGGKGMGYDDLGERRRFGRRG